MITHIKGVPKHHVAQRASFDANVSLDNLLQQVGEQGKLESVANSLRVKEDSIVHVGYVAVVSLSRVEEAGQVMGHTWGFLGS